MRGLLSPLPSFDVELRWQLAPQVALRPEPFGALAYHYGTRRLSFVKSRKLVDVLERLADEPNARAALAAAGVTTDELPTYVRVLDGLFETGMIAPRESA